MGFNSRINSLNTKTLSVLVLPKVINIITKYLLRASAFMFGHELWVLGLLEARNSSIKILNH